MVNNSVFFASGGATDSSKPLKTVLRMASNGNEWVKAPSLCGARYWHSNCAAGRKLFVFGGQGVMKQELNSIEYLDIDFSGKNWTPLRPGLKNFAKRCNAAMF